jgi:recombinational DNA repair protein RecR
MKVHGLLVCTYLFAQGDVDSCKDHNREEEKVCVREREKERIFQSSIVWTYQNPSSSI